MTASTPTPRHPALKARQRELRQTFPESLGLRVHRALSWLNRAEQEPDDHDARFIFLWIAFNAAYAQEFPNRRDFSETRLLLKFLNRLIDADRENLLYDLVWNRYPTSIRLLMDNRFVYQPYWDHVNGYISEAEWQERFDRSRASARRALGEMRTKKLFAATFERLYVLRNQVMHGGATWRSSINRDQIRDGANILGDVVPIVIHLMMENAHGVWGDACYPVVE
jgi:hypothetical protein